MIETKILESPRRRRVRDQLTALPDLSSPGRSRAATALQTLSVGTSRSRSGSPVEVQRAIDALPAGRSTCFRPESFDAEQPEGDHPDRPTGRLLPRGGHPRDDDLAAFVTFPPDTITEGIILSVTPQVGQDGRIMLAIHPSITEKVGEAKAPDGNTAPIVDVRETNTMVTVPDGETVFIGGLMQERTQEIVKSVPLLGDIPFLGAFFRNTDQKKKKTELVILITPRLLPTPRGGDRSGGTGELRRSDRGGHVGKPWSTEPKGDQRLTP
jgi:hypothetical protein